MQLGFRAALFESAVRFHERFRYDIALFSPDSVFIVRPAPFSNRRLYQALGSTDVADGQPRLHLPRDVEEPVDQRRGAASMRSASNPEDDVLDTPGFADRPASCWRSRTSCCSTAASRPEFGPVAEQLARRRHRSSPRSTTGRYASSASSRSARRSASTPPSSPATTTGCGCFPDRSRDEIELGLDHARAGRRPGCGARPPARLPAGGRAGA